MYSCRAVLAQMIERAQREDHRSERDGADFAPA